LAIMAAVTAPKVELGQVCAVLGSQWGDEGKGKVVDVIAASFDVCVRFNGGSNAGHTIVVGSTKYAFHLLPSAMLQPNTHSLIGNGVVVHVPTLMHELEVLDKAGIEWKSRLHISSRAHLVFDVHQTVDGLVEGELAQLRLGTTRKGIGPAYADKASRSGVRVIDLERMDEFGDKLRRIVSSAQRKFGKEQAPVDIDAELARYSNYASSVLPLMVDGVHWLNEQHRQGKRIVLEGANAAMLDLDFGTYPYVTSSSPTIGGCSTGSGLAASKIKDVVGVVKAYTTRVGEGPFPTELLDATGELIRATGREFGTTTGRPRRCGWLDVVVVRYSHDINGYTYLNLTKLDILSVLPQLSIGVEYVVDGKAIAHMPASLHELGRVEVRYETMPGWMSDISRCRSFAELPLNCQAYVRRIEQLVGVRVRWIGPGAGRDDMIECH